MHYTFNATLNRIDITTDADLFPGGRNVPHHNQKNIVMKPKKLIRQFIVQKLKLNEWELIEDKAELNRLYILKLKEEIAEIEKSNFEDISEFGDLVTVAFAFARMNGFNNEAVLSKMIEKALDKGEYSNCVLTNLNPENPSNALYFEPEPLDPHTCELCVGDVVEDMDTGYDFLIADIHDNDARTYFGINLVNYSIEVLFRTDLTLKSNQRAGVQIGEV